ncbi:putative ATP-grasp-modified RiPP [Salinispora arenicola]|nr:putative ATP-grasp-modified RiPP [Salinispora arenicola]
MVRVVRVHISPFPRGKITMMPIAFGIRQAVEGAPLPVDLSAIRFDPDRQISVITDSGLTVPALRHSTGTTSTNTASQDNKGGSDRDSDQTED